MTEKKFDLEQEMATSNEFYFLREFTFSSTKFDIDSGELELADSLILVGDAAIVFQLKQRDASASSDQDEKWFKNKVIRMASRQIKDTHFYLNKYSTINISNQRSIQIPISKSKIKRISNLIVYEGARNLTNESVFKKFHRSTTVGIIHILSFSTYKKVLTVLLSAGEIEEYLCFRAELIETWGEGLNKFTEKALVGQYLAGGDARLKPSEEYQDLVDQVSHEAELWDMSGILHNFFERIYKHGNYYEILREIAKLHRDELKLLKERFKLSMDKALAGEFTLPFRFVIPRTDCGFVLIPTEQHLRDVRQIGHENFTVLHKYDQKLKKCIGICFVGDGDGWCIVDWLYIESPWEYDGDIEKALKDNFPFRPVKAHPVSRYKFEKS